MHKVAVRIIVLFEQLTRLSKRGDGFLSAGVLCAGSMFRIYIYINISSSRLRPKTHARGECAKVVNLDFFFRNIIDDDIMMTLIKFIKYMRNVIL